MIMSKKKPRLKLPSRSNPVARAPILSKGGAHQKTRSAERQADKRQLRKLVTKVGADYGPADLAA
jgi:hypothetical protein